jgi:hypothetical protein
MMREDLKRLQRFQEENIGLLDISIETRADKQATMFTMTNYPKSRRLCIYKLSWNEDNTEKFEKIEKEIENLLKQTEQNEK